MMYHDLDDDHHDMEMFGGGDSMEKLSRNSTADPVTSRLIGFMGGIMFHLVRVSTSFVMQIRPFFLDLGFYGFF